MPERVCHESPQPYKKGIVSMQLWLLGCADVDCRCTMMIVRKAERFQTT